MIFTRKAFVMQLRAREAAFTPAALPRRLLTAVCADVLSMRRLITEPDENHAGHALEAALAMRAALKQFNTRRREQGAVEIRHGIGIHSGNVLAGNVGSEQRKTYSMLGDTVNLASRLQTLNKKLATNILISGETRRRLAQTDMPLQSMGNHAVRGKSESVDVYTVA